MHQRETQGYYVENEKKQKHINYNRLYRSFITECIGWRLSRPITKILLRYFFQQFSELPLNVTFLGE